VTAIQILMSEHRVIESAITALTAYAQQVANGSDLPRTDLVGFVNFLQEYADSHHHGKEEDILFRAMTENGMPVNGGPLAVMLAEHAEGRRLTNALSEISGGEGAWKQEERRQLLFAAASYERLLKSHIQKEDRVLYPMAAQTLPEDVWRQIESEFSAFQAAPQRAERAAELEQMAQEWVRLYAVAGEAS
jgi:hemerythrin-like domain-containing protein